MNKFETIYNECKLYEIFNQSKFDYVIDYNIFMTELEIQAEKLEKYEPKKFEFFMLSWRWNAQQYENDYSTAPTKKQFLKEVYDAYNTEH